MLEISLATLAGVREVARNLRPSDLAEAKATVGERYEDAVVSSYQNSTLCWMVLEDGKPFGVFGVTPSGHDRGVGCPWMMATPVIAKYSKELLKLTPWYVHIMNSMYPTLYNYVDVRNHSSIRWLKWGGFQFGETIPDFGESKVPFTTFYRYL